MADHRTNQELALADAIADGKRTALAVACPVCRPVPKVWSREFAGKAVGR